MTNDNELFRLRKQKLTQLRECGQAYPNDFRPTVSVRDLQERFVDHDAKSLVEENFHATLAGRLMTRRKMGKVTFCDLQDSTGRIQLFVKLNSVTEAGYEKFGNFDIGDIIGVTGRVFRTRTGELSVAINEFRLLTKALHPFPEKFHGLADQELRYRQRYLDLIINEDVRRTFNIRTAVVRSIRRFLDRHEFLEVETPMMHSIPGGAIARPFITHHNALSLDMYLRIAPELFLKRLVVGGFERVYEINRNFRNEGVSTQHNPEFTMLEFYQAYADYEDLMEFTEKMFDELVNEICGSSVIEYQGREIHLSPPFPRISLLNAVLERNPGLKAEDAEDRDRLEACLNEFGGHVIKSWGVGKLLFEIFEKTVETELYEPTFITHYPVEVSPLSRVNDSDPTITDRFEFFVAGMEIANGFSELNDPEDQAARFRSQLEQKESGDEEAMHFDEDYIRALEYGLPPTAGEGVGIDRLVMLLSNSASIRDVILFPYLKPQGR